MPARMFRRWSIHSPVVASSENCCAMSSRRPITSASTTLSGQCLANPEVLANETDTDPQARVFAELVESMKTRGRCRVLDFGAGKGRLADAIARNGDKLTGLSYYLYDSDPQFQGDREAVARKLTELGVKARVVDKLGSLRVAGSQVDLVVLCNVLHEIPPEDWLRVLTSIREVLVDDGKLVIIEDQEPSVGELPHNRGFLLLSVDEVAQLFGGAAYVEDRSPGKTVADGRVSVVCVARRHLRRANGNERSRALADLAARAKNEVDTLRSAGGEQRDGRRHALFMVLAYNALRATET